MPDIVPTTKALYDQFLSQIQATLNTTVSSAEKAFTKVLSAVLSVFASSVYRYANDSLKSLLITTATREQLIIIGEDLGVYIRIATTSTLTIEIAAYDGAVIDTDKEFIDDLTGLSFYPQSTTTATGATVEFNIISRTTGSDNNLAVDDTLTLSTPISGVGETATVTAIVTEAVDEEDTEVYRSRLLFARRNRAGGGNAYDYKSWAEEVTGVKRAYPITGLPFADESVEDFADGDCEASGTSDWTAFPVATAQMIKETSIVYEGVRSLKFYSSDSGIMCGVAQDCLTVGQGYTIKGYMVDTNPDGSNHKFLVATSDLVSSLNVIGLEETIGTWQYFEYTFVALDTYLLFGQDKENNDYDDPYYIDFITLEPSRPLERTVFIEAIEELDVDGIPTQTLLDLVRENIITDPITGYHRMPMSHIEDMLYVWPIYRTSIYVRINSLIIDSALESDCKGQIEADLDTFFRSLFYYNAAVDSEVDKANNISDASLGAVIYTILSNYGASMTSVDFDLDGSFSSPLVSYYLKAGELCKLGAVSYG